MRSRVLVVDDNHQLAENLAELLADEGCVVSTAFSAEEALRAADLHHFAGQLQPGQRAGQCRSPHHLAKKQSVRRAGQPVAGRHRDRRRAGLCT